MIHCDTYQSDALPLKGPESPSHKLSDDEIDLFWASPISGGVLDYTYPDGTRVFWVPKVDRVIKLRMDEHNNLKLLAEFKLPAGRFPYFSADTMKAFVNELDALPFAGPEYREKASQWRGYQMEALRAYYAMVSNKGVLYVGGGDRIVAYGDQNPGDPNSPIVPLGQFIFDRTQMSGDPRMGILIGINMTYDGNIIAVTIGGTAIAIRPDLKTGRYYRFPGEQIWNSLAIDENGGLYIVTNKKLYKLVWTGDDFSDKPEDGAWSEAYEIGPLDATPSRGNSRGSGTTAALMGLETDRDQFVTIADAADVNNLVLYWRDKIPADWKQLPGTQSRRVAGKIPVDFGMKEVTDSYSENSPIVLGYGAVLANNRFSNGETAFLDNQLRMTDTKIAPYGIQKFEWNPQTKTFATAWVRQDVSNPNSTPSISAINRQINMAAMRDGKWVFETLDWDTGQTKAIYELGASQRYNPVMLAVQLLPNGDPLYSVFAGVLHLKLNH